MTSTPVTIVIPTYNDGPTLEACLRSVLANTDYPDWNVILVDDGSTDASVDKIKETPRLTVIRQSHRGVAAALNAGIAAAGVRDIVRLHSDVVIQKSDWLTKLAAVAYGRPRAGIVGARLVYPDGRIHTEGRNIITGVGFHPRHRDRNAFAPDQGSGSVAEVDAVHGALAYYRRDVLSAVGGLDEKYGPVWTEDMDFCIAARFAGFKVYVDPSVQAVHFSRCWGPASMVRIAASEATLRQITWLAKQQGERAQAKYWEEKWGWNPYYPDLNAIRRLYGHTEICWQIGDRLRYRSEAQFPTVDCCLVTANNLALLKRCMESLAQTDYPPDRLKVYVADNGSTDGSIEYLDSLASVYPLPVQVTKLPLNTGVPVGLNWAVLQGNGELVARLDDDIVLPTNWLKLMVQDIQRRPFTGCVGAKILNDDARRGIQCGAYRHFPGLFGHEDESDVGQADYLARAIHVRGCCNLYRRDVFARCGLFDLRFSPSQFDDPEHHLALAAAGYEILYDGRVTVIHKLNNGLARSFAAISNQHGNATKMYGKWGPDIFEVLEKSLDLSREGRYLPDDGNTASVWLDAPQPGQFPRRNAQTDNEVSSLLKVIAQEFSSAQCLAKVESLAADYVKYAATQSSDGFPRSAVDTLSSTLNFAPHFVPAIEALAQTYAESGRPELARKIAASGYQLAPDNAVLRDLADDGNARRDAASHGVMIQLPQKSDHIGESSVSISSPSGTSPQPGQLRVLMVNTFENRTPGGDMHQLKKTRQYLEKVGVHADVCCTPRPDPRGYDLVHIFNLWFPHQTLAQLKAIRLQAPGIPVVMTPIYWNMAEKAWADAAVPQLFAQAGSEAELDSRLKQLEADQIMVNGRHRSQAAEPNFAGYQRYQLEVLKMVDYLLPQSDLEMVNLRQTLAVEKPFNLVHNGAEIEVFQKATPDWFVEKFKIRNFVLSVGLVEPRKNQLMLLHALKNLGVPAVIVGRNYDPGYLQLCRKYAPKNTLFIEHLPHELLASAFKAARVHALPSWMECASFANVEAALSGCALVVSDRTSEPEYFGANAYYADPASLTSIRRAVQKALQNHAADAPKRELLRQQFLTRYTWPNAARQTLRGYHAALALRPTAAQPKSAALNIPFTPSSPVPAPVKPTSDTPSVAVIIPTFNRLDLTQACLRALHQNTPTGLIETIVVDNASTDGTRDFLAAEHAAGRLTAILNEKNLGFAHACNQGAAAACAKYVLFLNNDTEVRPSWLTPLIESAETDSRIGALGSKLLYPDGTIQHAGVILIDDRANRDPLRAQHIFARQPAQLPEANQPRICPALTAACLFIPKAVFDSVHGFDEEFWNGYEDVDLCLRIAAAGKLLVYQPASTVTHHESQSGPERFRQARQNIARLHQKWIGKVNPDFIIEENGTAKATGAGRYTEYRPASVSDDSSPAASIIILALNQLEHTRACLESIAAHTPLAHEVIVVDNGSNDATPEFLKQWQLTHPECTVIRNDVNRGFAGGNNQGLAIARGKTAILLNNDTVVTPGWLDAMLATLARHPQTGIVGPMSNRVSGQQLVANVGYKNPADLPAFASQRAREKAGQSFETGRAVGFCLLATREVVTRLGGLDESFGPGNFEDDDYCIRALLAGYCIRIAEDSFVHHTGSQTFVGQKMDYRQAMHKNWAIFCTKWGLPADSAIDKGYRIPKQAPAGVNLNVSLPQLAATHQQAGDRCWLPQNKRAAQRPEVANLGRLDEARALFAEKNFAAAWNAATLALSRRPFHPEACLLLAEIAHATGAGKVARLCAQRARDFAPQLAEARRFLAQPLKGDAKPDWMDTSRLTPAEPRLSVCLIVKNEERFLAQCLKSIRGLAAQVIVVDTGSTDRTVEIAREFGADIHSFTWCHDFSAARNAALEHATGDWILMLDADEEFPTAQHANLRKEMNNAGNVAYRLPLINVGKEAEGRSFIPRLFRNVPGAFYTGRIHEQVFGSILESAKKWGLRTNLGSSEILHHGYTKEMVQDRNKVERNLALLRAAIDENPIDANLLMNLGLELVRSGELPAGIEQYRRAYSQMSAQTAGELVPELREVLLTQFTSQLYKVCAHQEVIEILNSPLAKRGGLTASLHFALGLAHFELRQFREAADQMRQCQAKRQQPALTPINTDILTAAPQHCLALCLAKLDQPEAADKAFQAALTATTGADAAQLDYAKFLREQKREVEALQQLHPLVTANGKNAAAWRLGGEIALSRPDFLEFALDWTAEALKALPDNPTVAAQRAETLMLNSKNELAVELWDKIWRSEPDPRALAAIILCETVLGQTGHRPNGGQDEHATSLAFIEWYQKLIGARAKAQIEKINSQLELLANVLPTAGQMLHSALFESDAPVAS